MLLVTVIESPLYYLENIYGGYKKFVHPSMSLWNGVITFFTVGYGDTYVVTYFGRFIVTILAIFSSIIISFITVAITTDFNFEE